MKISKRTSVILVLISLVVMSVTFYCVKYVVRDKTFSYNALAVIFTLLGIFVLYIAYKELIRHFGKGVPVKEDYATLYGLEKSRITGEVEFYFTLDHEKRIQFTVLDRNMDEVEMLADRDFVKGGHILRFDTGRLANGVYFYCLRSNNQKTLKRMLVQHDNVTA